MYQYLLLCDVSKNSFSQIKMVALFRSFSDQHKEGVARAHNSIKLHPIKGFDNKDHLQRLLQGTRLYICLP